MGMELLTNQQMAMADKMTVSHGVTSYGQPIHKPAAGAQLLSEFELLVNAGRKVAQHVSRRYRNGRCILVLCGPGNNGGDGYIAARILANRGCSVRVISVCGTSGTSAIGQQAKAYWGETIESTLPTDVDAQLAATDVVIDSMFGAGLTRELQGDPLLWINALERHPVSVVSVDVPSGLNADTGMTMGASVRATSTVTFFRLKPGHLLYPGHELCGNIEVADIGIDASVLDTIKPTCHLNEPMVWAHCFPRLESSHHKYHRGHTLVYCGPQHTTGAARLAARGALRIGSGLVTVAAPADAVAVIAAQLTAIMIAPWESRQDAAGILRDTRLNSVVIGPGFGVGDDTCELCLALLCNSARENNECSPAIVLDADALTSFQHRQDELFSAIRECEADVVLTPHSGEFSRLFDCQQFESGATQLAKARQAASRSSAIVVLKGPATVVAAPDGNAIINNNAPATLATAGSGDVLAGFIGGLLAQGMDGFAAACASVWLHGECANQFGAGLIAEDLPEQVPSVLANLIHHTIATGTDLVRSELAE